MSGLFGGGSSKPKETKSLYPAGDFTTDEDGNHLHSAADKRTSAPSPITGSDNGAMDDTILGGGMRKSGSRKMFNDGSETRSGW